MGAKGAELELMAAAAAQLRTSTEYVAGLAGQVINNVLDVFTATFDSTGMITRSYAVAAGSVKVRNLSGANAVTFAAGGPQATVPTTGVGVAVVPLGVSDTVPLAGHEFTLYGTSGQSVSVQVFTAAVRPVTP